MSPVLIINIFPSSSFLCLFSIKLSYAVFQQLPNFLAREGEKRVSFGDRKGDKRHGKKFTLYCGAHAEHIGSTEKIV